MRINYRTCRQIWGLSGIGKDQNAHPCSIMGQAFYTWRNFFSLSSKVRDTAVVLGRSIERKYLLDKYMNCWEDIHGNASCKRKILNRKFADWVYINRLKTQVKLSDEIVNSGRRQLNDIKLKHCLRRWLDTARLRVQQKVTDFIMRRNNFSLAAEDLQNTDNVYDIDRRRCIIS